MKRRTATPSLSKNGTATTAPSSASSYVSEDKLPPHGASVFWTIWDVDPAYSVTKTIYIIATIMILVCMVFLPLIATLLDILNVDWDNKHGIESFTDLLMHPRALGLSVHTLRAIFTLTAGVYTSLIGVDVVLGWVRSKNNKADDEEDDVWPKSWKTSNTLCYHDMFTEPTRNGCVLRRPGNTLSNATYLLTSLCVFSVTTAKTGEINTNPFYLADAGFAVMLLILTISSTIWHASNAPWSHYPDLWSMDSCIFYLLIRYACLGGYCLLTTTLDIVTVDTAQKIAGITCAAVYSTAVLAVAKFYFGMFQAGWLHGKCPLSTRARLSGSSNIFNQGHQDIFIGSTVCAYACLPLVYAVIPAFVLVGFVGSWGSILAVQFAMTTLVLGWSYRMFERWALDGCFLANYFGNDWSSNSSTRTNNMKQERQAQSSSLVRILGSAIFSPTAVLHALTGITLLAGYIHARSIDSVLFV